MPQNTKKHPFLFAAMLGLTLAAVPRCLAAQRVVTGRVVGLDHRPLIGASVAAWKGKVRLAATTTDVRGTFRLDLPGGSDSVRLSVRRIGFSPIQMNVDVAKPVRLVMSPLPVEVAPVRMAAASQMCPRREQSAAAAVWEALRSRYALAYTDTGVVAPKARESISRVVQNRLGLPDTLRQLPGVFGRTTQSRHAATRRIADSGYAYQVIGANMDRRFDYWEYPDLERTLFGHFLDTLFGRLHTFFFADSSGNRLDLGFCPRSTRHGEIQGVLRLSTDTTLVGAVWRFLVPRHDEHAGGAVTFAPPLGGTDGLLLVPTTGVFWRKTASGYVQVWTEDGPIRFCAAEDLRACRRGVH